MLSSYFGFMADKRNWKLWLVFSHCDTERCTITISSILLLDVEEIDISRVLFGLSVIYFIITQHWCLINIGHQYSWSILMICTAVEYEQSTLAASTFL